ncbi:MAG: DUF4838 domain-containing protein [Clostridia bacterium]|nr:DUF4838 domain-containing protein [Clostridia bacterium]
MAKKIICMMLALSMMLTVLAACNNEPVDPVENPNDQQQEENQGNEGAEVISDVLNLVVDGVSDYVIVRGENAYISEVTASTELQKYLKQISGVEIPIVTDAVAPVAKEIVVGKTNRESDDEFDRTELGTDGFVIKTENGKLWLVGGEKRGTLYAVYTFLEEYLGCRFYTDTFERIPEMKTVSLEKIEENKQIPVFETRNSFWYDMWNHSLSAKLKLNCRRGRGDIPEALGGSLSWAGGECHTLYALAEMTGDHMWNEPCLTSEDVYQTVLKNVRALLAAKPTAKYISISQNDSDNRREGCECDNCMALYNKYGCWTGPYLEFVNRVAREIKDEYPDVMIHTFAYRFTRLVPENLVPEDNVMIQLCTIEGCFRHPLEDYKELTPADKYNYIDDFAALLKDWAKVCNYLSVWDYTTDFGHYSLTFANFDSLRQNVRLFADNNVKNLFEQGAYQSENGEFGELRGYVIARLLWDPYMSEEEYWAMIDEFLVDYYGPGGLKIREYIDLTLEATKDIHMGIGASPKELYPMPEVVEVNPAGTYPPELNADMIINYKNYDWTKYWTWFKDVNEEHKIVTEGKRLFAEAMAMAETDAQKSRIEKCAIQVDYLESCYLEYKLSKGVGTIGKIISNFYTANPDAVASELKSSLRIEILKYANEQVYADYIEFNRQLAEKMLKYGIHNVRESFWMNADTDINFKNPPYEWDD